MEAVLDQGGNLFAQILAFFAWVWAFWQTKFILAHIGVNVTVAIAASVYTGDFVLARTGEFLLKKAVPFIFIFAVCAIMAEAANLGWLTVAAWAALELILAGDLTDNLGKMGVKMPEGLKK